MHIKFKMFEGLEQIFLLTLIRARGGGWNPPYAQEIGCHFSRNDPNVLKLPDFFKNDVGPKVIESFWAYLECKVIMEGLLSILQVCWKSTC